MDEVVALLTFTFAATVSPGPNNTVLWASGMRFRFRRTLPHVLGTVLGIGIVFAAVAAGVGTILEAVPWLEVALKVAGSAYLLLIACQLAISRSVRRADVWRPMTVWQAALFQCVNPKVLLFVLAAVGTFLEADAERGLGAMTLAALVLPIAGLSSAVWAVGGAALARVVARERTLAVINVALGALLVGSVALLWV